MSDESTNVGGMSYGSGEPPAPNLQAEAAVQDFLDENPLGSESFKKNEAQYQELNKQAYGHLDDAEESDASPAGEYEEGSPQAQMAEIPGGPELLQEWGSDFDSNFHHARVGLTYAMEEMPDVIEALAIPVQREDGTTYIPGDDAGWIKIAAQFGRLRAHRDGIEDEFKAITETRAQTRALQQREAAMPSGSEAVQIRIDEIMATTPPGSAGYAKPRVQNELNALYAALGEGPIVGMDTRTI